MASLSFANALRGAMKGSNEVGNLRLEQLLRQVAAEQEAERRKEAISFEVSERDRVAAERAASDKSLKEEEELADLRAEALVNRRLAKRLQSLGVDSQTASLDELQAAKVDTDRKQAMGQAKGAAALQYGTKKGAWRDMAAERSGRTQKALDIDERGVRAQEARLDIDRKANEIAGIRAHQELQNSFMEQQLNQMRLKAAQDRMNVAAAFQSLPPEHVASIVNELPVDKGGKALASMMISGGDLEGIGSFLSMIYGRGGSGNALSVAKFYESVTSDYAEDIDFAAAGFLLPEDRTILGSHRANQLGRSGPASVYIQNNPQAGKAVSSLKQELRRYHGDSDKQQALISAFSMALDELSPKDEKSKGAQTPEQKYQVLQQAADWAITYMRGQNE